MFTQAYYQMAGNADWQEAYLINNSNYNVQVKAKTVGISNINDLVHVKIPLYEQTWLSPAKVGDIGSVITLNKLNPLYDVTLQVLTHDRSKLPQWLQPPHRIMIQKGNPGDILLIFISHRSNNWVVNYKYVKSVQIAYNSPSGYSIIISQR
jgi:hypothetical protein